jgi:hypothetical protein
MASAKGAHRQPVDIQSETHGAVATLLKAAPFLQVVCAQANVFLLLRGAAECARVHCTRHTAGENL